MEEQEKNYVLVTLNYNWADEFDVNSFWVTTKEEYQQFINKLINFGTDYDISQEEFYFGSNESITFDSIEDILHSLTDVSISTEFANNLIEHLGEEYGLFSITAILELIEYFESEDDEKSN